MLTTTERSGQHRHGPRATRRTTAYLAINALVSGIAATVVPLLGGLAATLFKKVRPSPLLSVGLLDPWTGKRNSRRLLLHGLDFVFLLSFLIGIYSLHRLALLREPGKAADSAIQQEFQMNRAIDNFKQAGLRDLIRGCRMPAGDRPIQPS